jgi:hypothetical protein
MRMGRWKCLHTEWFRRPWLGESECSWSAGQGEGSLSCHSVVVIVTILIKQACAFIWKHSYCFFWALRGALSEAGVKLSQKTTSDPFPERRPCPLLMTGCGGVSALRSLSQWGIEQPRVLACPLPKSHKPYRVWWQGVQAWGCCTLKTAYNLIKAQTFKGVFKINRRILYF